MWGSGSRGHRCSDGRRLRRRGKGRLGRGAWPFGHRRLRARVLGAIRLVGVGHIFRRLGSVAVLVRLNEALVLGRTVVGIIRTGGLAELVGGIDRRAPRLAAGVFLCLLTLAAAEGVRSPLASAVAAGSSEPPASTLDTTATLTLGGTTAVEPRWPARRAERHTGQ